MNAQTQEQMDNNPTHKALLAVRAMRKKLEDIQRRQAEPLAIVGMACRLPGGIQSPEAFWQLLLEQRDPIVDIPSSRWDLAKHFHEDPAEPGKMYVNQGGFVDQVYHFDRELFDLSQRESMSMDPQQRLLLELSWEALERAGIAPRKSASRKRTGLFIGMATNDYSRFHLHSNRLEDIDVYSFTGCAPSIASGRIAQLLDLGGPTLSIDTACSSSIVALHLARQSILNDECDTALVGGVNLMLSPENTVYFCKTSALSPDGRCKTFAEDANGYVRSEGGGMLVVKRLRQALEDGDNILAVIHGSAVNHDGEGIGLTAPNGDAQQRLVEQALKNARVNKADISYVETHGTGTPLGDPIELQALGRVFSGRETPVLIGSCKSNIGHTEAAAGIASVIKTVLCLQHKQLVPNLHFRQPSSYIPWQQLPLRVVTDVEDWQPLNGQRLAGVSAFGFSGSNAHVIVGEAPAKPQIATPAGEQLLVLSGKSPNRLKALAQASINLLSTESNATLAAFCRAMNQSKYPFNYRLTLASDNTETMVKQLQSYLDGTLAEGVGSADLGVEQEAARIAIDLCSGELFKAGMPALQASLPAFNEHYQECVTGFQQRGLQNSTTSHDVEFLAEFQHFPTEFSACYALLSVLDQLSGPLDEINASGPGLLAAAVLKGDLYLSEALDLIAAFVCGKNYSFNQAAYSDSDTQCFCNGRRIKIERSFSFWYKVLTQKAPKHFTPWVEDEQALLLDLTDTFIHGARAINLAGLKENPKGWLNRLWAQMFTAGRDINWQALYRGSDIAMAPQLVTPFVRQEYRLPPPELFSNSPELRSPEDASLPRLTAGSSAGYTTPGHPLLGQRLPQPGCRQIVFQQRLAPGQSAFLYDHGFLQQVVVPATAYLEIMVAGLQQSRQTTQVQLEDVVYHAGLYLPTDDAVYLRLEICGDQIQLFSTTETRAFDGSDQEWTLHCSANITPEIEAEEPLFDLNAYLPKLNGTKNNEDFYTQLNRYGYLFGPAHQGVSQVVKLNDRSSIALVTAPSSIVDEFSQYFFHPAHLDSCCHAILALLNKTSREHIFITLGKDRVRMLQPAQKTVIVQADLVENTEFSVKANLRIYALSGQCLALVEGYTMKNVARHLLASPESGINAARNTEGYHLPPDYSQWLYSCVWQTCAAPKPPQLQGSQWLMTADSAENSTLAEVLTELITSAGGSVHWLTEPELQQTLLKRQQDGEISRTGIIHLAVNAAAKSNPDGEDYFSLTRCLRILSEVDTPAAFFCITRGSRLVDKSEAQLNLHGASLWGAGRAISLEMPNLRFANIDLDPNFPILADGPLLNILSGDFADEDQFALRQGQLFVPRLKALEAGVNPLQENDLGVSSGADFKLAIQAQGSIDDLFYKASQREELQPDDVEIEVSAAALNFYDVVTALDLIDTSIVNGKENDECRFGLDAVGKITRVGCNVKDYQTGDWVMGFAPGCLASHVRVHQHCVTHKPRDFSIGACATLPTAFLTAWYALKTLAKMKKGDRVFIHAAAGGVGIAAINIANIVGAEVFATASQPKWPLLRSLGVNHIYDSRKLEFAAQALNDTQGEGVDIVLNSFIGEYIPLNVEMLKPGGRFVEIGEREILTDAQLRAFAKPFDYYPFTLFDISRDHPQQIKAMFDEMAPCWESTAYTGIPFQVYPAHKVKEAFRIIQAGQHQGKLVIDLTSAKPRHLPPVTKSEAVLITGGLGGIGWAAAEWLSDTRVGAVYLMGRSPLTAADASRIHTLASKGTQVRYLQADVADRQQLAAALDQIKAEGRQLEAILHAAGAMKNALIVDENKADADAVLAAKTKGSWNLHQVSLQLPIKHFICFSSVTSLLGAAGAASYAAGNAFEDHLMAMRQALGLPGQSINWGAWEDVGMLTRLHQAAQDYWLDNGMQALPSATALSILEKLSEMNNGNLGVLPADWPTWNRQYAKLPAILKDLNNLTPGATEEAELPVQEPRGDYRFDSQDLVRKSLCKVMGLATDSALDREKSFRELGVDSLMSVELRNILSRAVGTKLSSTLLFNYSTIKDLATYLQAEFNATTPLQETPHSAHKTAPQPQPLGDMKKIVSEQLRAILRLPQTQKLDEQESFKNMGVDSLMSVELRNTLSRKLGVKLSSTLLFNYTTLAQLTEHLLTLVKTATPAEPLAISHKHTSSHILQPQKSANDDEPTLNDIRALLDEKLLEMED